MAKSTVVDNVSFEIHKGMVTSFIGPNGAGKSTVIGMISRLVAKDQGIDFISWKRTGKME